MEKEVDIIRDIYEEMNNIKDIYSANDEDYSKVQAREKIIFTEMKEKAYNDIAKLEKDFELEKIDMEKKSKEEMEEFLVKQKNISKQEIDKLNKIYEKKKDNAFELFIKEFINHGNS